MPTPHEREDFHAAYRAWRDLRQAHDGRLREAFTGGPYDLNAALAEAHELHRLHADFLETSRLFLVGAGASSSSRLLNELSQSDRHAP